MLQAVFVYGTLKRGQCRAGLWPLEPLSVEVAWTRGTLFSRSDYPAMTAGEDRILGELWRFLPDEMPRVVHVLDQIEGTNRPGQADLYVRVATETWDLGNRLLETAYVYHYATDPRGDGFVRIQASESETPIVWPAT